MDLEKLKLDPYYYDLYQKYGEDFIIEAGYFESSATIVDIKNYNCTPIYFLRDEYRLYNYNHRSPVRKLCVLVTTGSFAPIHSGHVDMMMIAKRKMIKQGYEVIGGYFCPDHDDYITSKLGEEAININERVKAIDRMTWDEKTKWLTADPWMGLYCNGDVNFTVVIDRLQEMINSSSRLMRVKEPVEVIFVCGEDRVNFALTFVEKGKCIVVRRSEEMHKIKSFLYDLDNRKDIPKDFLDRVLFDFDNVNYESSTNIRKSYVKKLEKTDLILRLDSRDDNMLNNAIVSCLKKYYNKVTTVDIAEQEKNFNKLNVPIISLDPFMKGEINIPISRIYDRFGFKFLKFGVRPEARRGPDSLYSYIDNHIKFKDKEYWLFDDDICGGSTIRYIKSILKAKGVKIAGVITFLQTESDIEVMDIRDLIYDSKYGGLVINDSRSSYCYPWVDPYIRASILNPEQFSKEINFINDEYKKSIEDFQKKCSQYLESI